MPQRTKYRIESGFWSYEKAVKIQQALQGSVIKWSKYIPIICHSGARENGLVLETNNLKEVHLFLEAVEEAKANLLDMA